MIYQKKGTKNKFINFNVNNTVVVTDFDATLTTASCKSSWALLTESKTMPIEFYEQINKLNEKYAPYETDMLLLESVKENLTSEWSRKEFELLFNNEYKEKYLSDTISSSDTPIKFRKGVKQFLSFLNKHNIKLFIVSAGISNSIELLLKKNKCLYPNITIISNKIIFENNIAKCLENDEIVNLYNKNIITEKYLSNIIDDNKNILLFGDVLNDANMCDNLKYKNIIKVGFFEKKSDDLFKYYKNTYDLVCTNNSNFIELIKVLFNKSSGINFI